MGQHEAEVLLISNAVSEDNHITVTKGVTSGLSSSEVTLRAGSHRLLVQSWIGATQFFLIGYYRNIWLGCQLRQEVLHNNTRTTRNHRRGCCTI